MINIHGFDDTAPNYGQATGLWKTGPENGIVVAHPQGFHMSWNAGSCCGDAKRLGVDDVNYISEVMDVMINEYNVDPKNIFVSGHSNGGGMTNRIGCELGKRVRGIFTYLGFWGSKNFAESSIAAQVG